MPDRLKHKEVQLWEEVRYEGSTPTPPQDLEHEEALWEQIDDLIKRESRYDPDDQPSGFLSNRRSSMGFQTDAEESLSIDSRRKMCPALEKTLGGPIDARRRILFILGTQKGGTTYMFNALTKHPLFVGADHAYGCERWLPYDSAHKAPNGLAG
jgi:hypothetical protein